MKMWEDKGTLIDLLKSLPGSRWQFVLLFLRQEECLGFLGVD